MIHTLPWFTLPPLHTSFHYVYYCNFLHLLSIIVINMLLYLSRSAILCSKRGLITLDFSKLWRRKGDSGPFHAGRFGLEACGGGREIECHSNSNNRCTNMPITLLRDTNQTQAPVNGNKTQTLFIVLGLITAVRQRNVFGSRSAIVRRTLYVGIVYREAHTSCAEFYTMWNNNALS